MGYKEKMMVAEQVKEILSLHKTAKDYYSQVVSKLVKLPQVGDIFDKLEPDQLVTLCYLLYDLSNASKTDGKNIPHYIADAIVAKVLQEYNNIIANKKGAACISLVLEGLGKLVGDNYLDSPDKLNIQQVINLFTKLQQEVWQENPVRNTANGLLSLAKCLKARGERTPFLDPSFVNGTLEKLHSACLLKANFVSHLDITNFLCALDILLQIKALDSSVHFVYENFDMLFTKLLGAKEVSVIDVSGALNAYLNLFIQKRFGAAAKLALTAQGIKSISSIIFQAKSPCLKATHSALFCLTQLLDRGYLKPFCCEDNAQESLLGSLLNNISDTKASLFSPQDVSNILLYAGKLINRNCLAGASQLDGDKVIIVFRRLLKHGSSSFVHVANFLMGMMQWLRGSSKKGLPLNEEDAVLLLNKVDRNATQETSNFLLALGTLIQFDYVSAKLFASHAGTVETLFMSLLQRQDLKAVEISNGVLGFSKFFNVFSIKGLTCLDINERAISQLMMNLSKDNALKAVNISNFIFGLMGTLRIQEKYTRNMLSFTLDEKLLLSLLENFCRDSTVELRNFSKLAIGLNCLSEWGLLSKGTKLGADNVSNLFEHLFNSKHLSNVNIISLLRFLLDFQENEILALDAVDLNLIAKFLLEKVVRVNAGFSKGIRSRQIASDTIAYLFQVAFYAKGKRCGISCDNYNELLYFFLQQQLNECSLKVNNSFYPSLRLALTYSTLTLEKTTLQALLMFLAPKQFISSRVIVEIGNIALDLWRMYASDIPEATMHTLVDKISFFLTRNRLEQRQLMHELTTLKQHLGGTSVGMMPGKKREVLLRGGAYGEMQNILRENASANKTTLKRQRNSFKRGDSTDDEPPLKKVKREEVAEPTYASQVFKRFKADCNSNHSEKATFTTNKKLG